MKYVVDASVALKWELPEQDSVKALALRDDFVSNVHTLIAPDVFPIEVGHALARAERRGILTPAQGAAAIRRILKQLPRLFASVVLLPNAYDIASKECIGVYDCLYLHLAQQENCTFVTADQKLLALSGYPVTDLRTL